MKKLLFIALTLITSLSMQAQNNTEAPRIVVTGEGKTSISPDEAVLSIGAEIKGKNAATVKLENDKIISNMIAFLKKNNIAEKDFKTQNVSLNKQRDYEEKEDYFVANQILTIHLRDISKYETIMFGLINAGANTIQGVEFKSSKTASFETEVRAKAVEDAKKKANDFAKPLNQSVGKAIFVSDNSQVINPRLYAMEAKMMAADASGSQTVAPGEIEIISNVTIHFQLGL